MIRAHVAYLKYVLRHKWYVLQACPKVGVSLWRGLTHDLSKFLPSEWGPYVRAFYQPDGSRRPRSKNSVEFDLAWNAHQKRNPHHWQYFLLRRDDGEVIALWMPEEFAREMVADWIGAGRAITGKDDVSEWFEKNREKIVLHPMTRSLVEQLIEESRP